MKIAVVAATRQGVVQAEQIAARLNETGHHETVMFLPEKFLPLSFQGQCRPYSAPLKEVLRDLFGEYQGIVCVMALGIVVRLIAPHLQGKTKDPAVVVTDELGQNVISVLSGHWGGANALTLLLAKGLGANPVITTATDVHGLPAIEMLAKEHGWLIEPFELVKRVNSAIVNGEKVVVFSEIPLAMESAEHIEVKDLSQYSPTRPGDGRIVMVTNRMSDSFPPDTLYLRPRNLCIGIGCRRGVGSGEVRAAINNALTEARRVISAVRTMASVDIKSDEQGLLAAAEELNLPVRFFARQALGAVLAERSEMGFSEFVDDKIGVGGVCEPAAILGAGENSRLILPKTKYGKITVAIAEGDWQ